MTNCAACGAANDPNHKFCARCGQAIAPAPTCTCGAVLPPGARFCTSCGAAAGARVEAATSAVVDGEWVRAPGEFVRKVSGPDLRNAFASLVPGIDLDAFVRGSLVGKVVDALLARTIRVPHGSVGVLMRDGACFRVLPPGEQFTATAWKELLAGRPGELAEHVLGVERVALYLVDRRPIPLGFVLDAPMKDGGLATVHVQATAAPGASRDALAAFVNEVVRDRSALSAADLHARLRTDVEQATKDALRARPGDLGAAEKEARRILEAGALRATGLRLDLVLAPRDTVHRVDVGLSGELVTEDAIAVDLDVVLTVQGDRAPIPPNADARAAAKRHLRDKPYADVATAAGFAALEAALTEALAPDFAHKGQRLVSVDVIDVRSTSGQWALGARAAMSKAKAEAAIGREWLVVKGEERTLEALTLAAALEQQKIGRDHAFAAREAAIADARRHADLDASERDLAGRKRDAEHADALASGAQQHERAKAAEVRRAEIERERMALESEKKRRGAEDESHAEKLRREARLEELRGMAALDADIAEREQRHRLETMAKLEGKTEAQILAMQASDLAAKEHGAAFAEALGKIADGDAARRERERADARLDAKDERMMELLGKMVGAGPRTNACTRCGAILPPTAQFCGECGTSRPAPR